MCVVVCCSVRDGSQCIVGVEVCVCVATCNSVLQRVEGGLGLTCVRACERVCARGTRMCVAVYCNAICPRTDVYTYMYLYIFIYICTYSERGL